jgi:hypothetical protein
MALQSLLNLGLFFSFLTLQMVELLRRGMSARPLPPHRTTQTYAHTGIRALSGIRTRDFSVRASEDGSCLRLRDHWDRLALERAKTVHALDRATTVIGIASI